MHCSKRKIKNSYFYLVFLQLLELDGWQGEGLAAVEHLDRVLEEIDV